MTLVIVDCALYRSGVRVEETRNLVRLAAMARSDPDAFVWMGMHEPTETDLVGAARVFGLHQLAVEDAVVAHQRPKLDVYDGHLFAVLRTLTYDKVDVPGRDRRDRRLRRGGLRPHRPARGRPRARLGAPTARGAA